MSLSLSGSLPDNGEIPLIDGAAAWGVARVEQRVEAGDHVIVVARLLYADADDRARPLLYHDGEYRPLTAAAAPGRSHDHPPHDHRVHHRSGDYRLGDHRPGGPPVASRFTVIRTEDGPA